MINNQNNFDKIYHLQIIQELRDLKEELHKNKKNNIEITNQKIEEKKEEKIEIPEKNDFENILLKTFKIFFKPNEDVFKMAIDPISVIRDLVDLGPNKVFSISEFIPPINQIIFDNCYLAWIIYISATDENTLRDVFVLLKTLQL